MRETTSACCYCVLTPCNLSICPCVCLSYPTGLRSDTSIVVETAQAFSTHHAAMLIGYGAHALCPYLAYETARQWRLSSRTQSLVKSGKVWHSLDPAVFKFDCFVL